MAELGFKTRQPGFTVLILNHNPKPILYSTFFFLSIELLERFSSPSQSSKVLIIFILALFTFCSVDPRNDTVFLYISNRSLFINRKAIGFV